MEEGGNRSYHPRAIPRRVVRKARHIMTYDVPYRVICAWNAAMCSVGSELPSYVSSIERRKCDGIGVSSIYWTKGEPRRGTSPHLSFVLRVLRTSLILWFTRRSCSLRKSVESEESVSGSGKLRVDALGVSSGRLATTAEGA
ncbi:hypothetical protein GW17_00007266 [Ensete ventricosum]|nr:hypothetical protein GW17_00007266 [Ensete ventricosum]